jgi:SAM-dependent methyltransferase
MPARTRPSVSHPSSPDEVVFRELIARGEGDGSGGPQFGSLAGVRQYQRLYRMVRRHLEPGAQVLDWGTDCGHFSYFLTRAGYRATGFNLEGVSRAGWLDEPYERYVGGNPAEPVRLPFADAEFDAVASIGVLEHVRETGGTEAASLSEIRRVLRPGGVFLCYHFPNRTSWIDLASSLVPGKHHHEYRYVRADIERLTRQAGFELLEVGRYGILPRNIMRRLPGPLRHAGWVADLWDTADAVAGAALPPLCQNHAFVARRPGR